MLDTDFNALAKKGEELPEGLQVFEQDGKKYRTLQQLFDYRVLLSKDAGYFLRNGRDIGSEISMIPIDWRVVNIRPSIEYKTSQDFLQLIFIDKHGVLSHILINETNYPMLQRGIEDFKFIEKKPAFFMKIYASTHFTQSQSNGHKFHVLRYEFDVVSDDELIEIANFLKENLEDLSKFPNPPDITPITDVPKEGGEK